MTRPSSDELIPWEAGAGVGVGDRMANKRISFSQSNY